LLVTPRRSPTTSGPYNFAGIVDVSDEAEPTLMSLLPIPSPAPDAGIRTQHARRRSVRKSAPSTRARVFADDDLMFMTWFNAGLRVYDISDAYLPRRDRLVLTDDPPSDAVCCETLVTQSEDVLVDRAATSTSPTRTTACTSSG